MKGLLVFLSFIALVACKEASRITGPEEIERACTGPCLGGRPSSHGRFQWGVNGHPFTQQPYKDEERDAKDILYLERQIQQIKALGVSWYRIDLLPDADRDDLLREAKRQITKMVEAGIKVLPILFPPISVDLIRKGPSDPNFSSSMATAYDVSYNYAAKVVAELAPLVDVWALHNELDVHTASYPQVAGVHLLDYDISKINFAVEILKGLSDAVAAKDPGARRIINSSGGSRYGFLETIAARGVPFEIAGWHWYSPVANRVDIINKKEIPFCPRTEEGPHTGLTTCQTLGNLNGKMGTLERLKRTLKKPIWLTEYGRKETYGQGGYGSQNGNQRVEGAYAEMDAVTQEILDSAASFQENYGLEAVFFYELANERFIRLIDDHEPKVLNPKPDVNREGTPIGESYFGLLDDQLNPKPSFRIIQRFLGQ